MIYSPIVEVKPQFLLNDSIRVFTTLEGENPGGSIKDHMVQGELDELMQTGLLKKNSLISEVSAGSTALSLAYYGNKYGLKCHLFLPLEASIETIDKLKSLGAELHLVARKDLYSAHDLFCKKTGSYPFNQLYDSKKSRHYKAMGQYIKSELKHIDLIIGAVGTGHSLKGLASAVENTKIFTAEPLPPYRVNGIRNLESERYGEQDSCVAADFDQRILISEAEMIKENIIETTIRPISIGTSFQLVLSAIKKIENGKKFPIVLALGANNRYF